MFFIGTLEWLYLYRLGTMRPAVTPLKDAEKSAAQPVDSTSNFGVAAEKDRRQVEFDGINARELVKLFRVEPPKDSKQRTRRKSPILKSAVKMLVSLSRMAASRLCSSRRRSIVPMGS